MSHSTVCNTIVFAKKKLVPHWCNKYASCVLLACKRNAPAIVKEERTAKCMCICANNQAWIWMCVCVSVIITQISSRQLLVWICNESAPGSAQEKRAQRYVCLCTWDLAWVWVCVCVGLSSSLFSRQLFVCACMYVCICMLTPLNDCDYIRHLFYCNTVNNKVFLK